MAKKKKQPKNAFYFFMRDFKEEQEQKGVRFANGMKDVADMAAPVWQDLPMREKQHYENMAAEEKRKERGNLENKFTTTGVSYAELERQERERQMAENKMKEEIEGTVQGLDRATTLKTKVFHFVHFNYYCRLENGRFVVCEVAVAEFNLEEGVRDVFHTLIRSEVPLGYSFEAGKTSDETHRIPVPPLSTGEHYHGDLFIKLKSFLERTKKGSTLPPVYTLPSHIEVAQTTLDHLAECHYPQKPDLFRVYPITKLFFELRNACSRPGQRAFPVMHLAEREMDKDLYNFAPGISCELHEGGDACVFCSRSVVHRWGFLICDHCCKDIDIIIIPGQHVPVNAAVKGDENSPAQKGRAEAAGGSSRPQSRTQTPVTLIEYSKLPVEKRTINLSAAGGSIVPPVPLGGSCWGVRREIETPPLQRESEMPPLRQETGLQPLRLPRSTSAAVGSGFQWSTRSNVPDLSSDDFPALGRATRSPMGRGKGRGEIPAEAAGPAGPSRVPAVVAGRGKAIRIAANLGALSVGD